MRGPAVTTFLELFGVFCLAAFAFFLWPPACLLVVGVAALWVSWQSTASKAPDA